MYAGRVACSPRWVTVSMPTRQTDGRTPGLVVIDTLRFLLCAASVIIIETVSPHRLLEARRWLPFVCNWRTVNMPSDLSSIITRDKQRMWHHVSRCCRVESFWHWSTPVSPVCDAASVHFCPTIRRTGILVYRWLRGTVVERRSVTGELSRSYARPAADGWPVMWVNRPLQGQPTRPTQPIILSKSINE